MNNFLKITFVLLLLVTISEVAYYLYYTFSKNGSSISISSIIKKNDELIDPSLCLNSDKFQMAKGQRAGRVLKTKAILKNIILDKPPKKGNKTYLKFDLVDEKGALIESLNVFNNNNSYEIFKIDNSGNKIKVDKNALKENQNVVLSSLNVCDGKYLNEWGDIRLEIDILN